MKDWGMSFERFRCPVCGSRQWDALSGGPFTCSGCGVALRSDARWISGIANAALCIPFWLVIAALYMIPELAEMGFLVIFPLVAAPLCLLELFILSKWITVYQAK